MRFPFFIQIIVSKSFITQWMEQWITLFSLQIDLFVQIMTLISRVIVAFISLSTQFYSFNICNINFFLLALKIGRNSHTHTHTHFRLMNDLIFVSITLHCVHAFCRKIGWGKIHRYRFSLIVFAKIIILLNFNIIRPITHFSLIRTRTYDYCKNYVIFFIIGFISHPITTS